MLQTTTHYTDAILKLNARDNSEAAKTGRCASYNIETQQFVIFLKDNEYNNPADGLLAYAESMARSDKKRLAAATYNKRLSCAKKRVRQLLEAQDNISLAEYGCIERAINRLKPKKINNVAAKPSQILTLPEIRRLIDETDPTIALLVEFLASTGCRISEALNILLTDVSYPPGDFAHIRVLGKRSKERWVYATKSLIGALKAHFTGVLWLFEHGGKQYSRIACTQRIKHESIRVLRKAITAHSLRHSYATYLINEKRLPEKKVAQLLGHSSTAVTSMIYNAVQATPADGAVHV